LPAAHNHSAAVHNCAIAGICEIILVPAVVNAISHINLVALYAKSSLFSHTWL